MNTKKIISMTISCIVSLIVMTACGKYTETVDMTFGDNFTADNAEYSKYTDIKWLSDNNDVAKIDGNVFEASGVGTAVINGMNKDKSVVEYTLNITALKTSYKLEYGSSENINSIFGLDGSVDISSYKTESSDNSVIEISDGRVVSLLPGKAIISLSNSSGKTAECEIESVIVHAESITIMATEKEMIIGDTMKLEKKLSPDNASDYGLKWSSSDSDIATVSENGTVEAISAGNVTITCESEDGIKDKIQLTLKYNKNGHVLRPNELEGINASKFTDISKETYSKAVMGVLGADAAYSTYDQDELSNYATKLESEYNVFPIPDGNIIKVIVSYGDSSNSFSEDNIGFVSIDLGKYPYQVYICDKYEIS